MLVRKEINNREDWLEARMIQGIGGSEAGAVAGMSKFKSVTDVFLEKNGTIKPKDLSDNEAVKRGVLYEPVLREMYMKAHMNDEVEYHPYDILYQDDTPWLFATLDGEISRDGRMGILEIKTASIGRTSALEEWNGKIPDGYFCQVLHQMLATGYDFAVVLAALFMWDGSIRIYEYEFTREECKADMNWLYTVEDDFMQDLKHNRMPKMKFAF